MDTGLGTASDIVSSVLIQTRPVTPLSQVGSLRLSKSPEDEEEDDEEEDDEFAGSMSLVGYWATRQHRL